MTRRVTPGIELGRATRKDYANILIYPQIKNSNAFNRIVTKWIKLPAPIWRRCLLHFRNMFRHALAHGGVGELADARLHIVDEMSNFTGSRDRTGYRRMGYDEF